MIPENTNPDSTFNDMNDKISEGNALESLNEDPLGVTLKKPLHGDCSHSAFHVTKSKSDLMSSTVDCCESTSPESLLADEMSNAKSSQAVIDSDLFLATNYSKKTKTDDSSALTNFKDISIFTRIFTNKKLSNYCLRGIANWLVAAKSVRRT